MDKIRSLAWVLLLAIVAGGGFVAGVGLVGPASGAFWEWSKTAGNNATADPTINWAEGMSPSSVNDSARAMMARAAEYRDDISGLLTTGGTASAYTVTTNQGLDAIPTDGQMLAFTVHADNAINATLTADAGTTYTIQSAAGTALPAGVLLSGAPYVVKFKLASSAWVLHGFYGAPFVIPIGALIDYTGSTSPNSNFVLPAGQCISRTTYSTYFSLVSTRYGVCDGTTTFGVPDFRGTIAIAKDDMGGVVRGLVTTAGSSCDGTTLGTQCGAQNRTVAQANLPAVTLTTTIAAGQGSHFHVFNPLVGGVTATGSGGDAGPVNTNSPLSTSAATLPAMTGTTPLGGSGTALVTLPPGQIVTKLLRIF